MAPTHVAVYFESSGFFFLLSVVPSCIEARAFVCAKPAAASASRSEMAVARVVGVAKHSFVVLVGISVHEQIARVSVFAAVAQRSVAHPAFFQFFFQTYVENGFFIAVVNACLLGVVAFLFIRFDVRYQFGGKILHGNLCIALEEVFSVQENLVYGFSVYFYCSVIAYFRSGQLLHEVFECRTHRNAIGGCVVLEGVGLHFHFCRLGGYGGSLKHHFACAQSHCAELCLGCFLAQCGVAILCVVAYERNFNEIFACFFHA